MLRDYSLETLNPSGFDVLTAEVQFTRPADLVALRGAHPQQ